MDTNTAIGSTMDIINTTTGSNITTEPNTVDNNNATDTVDVISVSCISNIVNNANTAVDAPDATDVAVDVPDATDATNTVDTHDATDVAVDALDATDVTNTVDATDATNTVDVPDATDATNTVDAPDATDVTNTVDTSDIISANNTGSTTLESSTANSTDDGNEVFLQMINDEMCNELKTAKYMPRWLQQKISKQKTTGTQSPIKYDYNRNNILTFLQPVQTHHNQTPYQKNVRYLLMSNIIGVYTGMIKKITHKEDKIAICISMMNRLTGFLDVLHEDAGFTYTVKKKFDEFIIREKVNELIGYYNKIFNDNLYDDATTVALWQDDNPVISDEECNVLLKEYTDELNDRIARQNALRITPKFDENEIIGAKDKEGRWWMAKVLKIFSHLQHNIYYVEFLGWGEKFNEFIVDRYRLERFNPRKHRYYRPAYEKKPVSINTADIMSL